MVDFQRRLEVAKVERLESEASILKRIVDETEGSGRLIEEERPHPSTAGQHSRSPSLKPPPPPGLGRSDRGARPHLGTCATRTTRSRGSQRRSSLFAPFCSKTGVTCMCMCRCPTGGSRSRFSTGSRARPPTSRSRRCSGKRRNVNSSRPPPLPAAALAGAQRRVVTSAPTRTRRSSRTPSPCKAGWH